MLYILEGPRNSGKTTAVKKIKEAFGESAYVIKFQRTSRPTPPLFMTQFLSKHWLALIDSRSICVLDRFHLTEFVYRTLDKKVSQEILITTTYMLEIMLKHVGAVTYVLQATPETRQERYKFRDEAHRKLELGLKTKDVDAAWDKAIRTFVHADVRVWPSNNLNDINLLVLDIAKHKKGGRKVNQLISPLPPQIIIEEAAVMA
jgi:thymidylate kinase